MVDASLALANFNSSGTFSAFFPSMYKPAHAVATPIPIDANSIATAVMPPPRAMVLTCLNAAAIFGSFPILDKKFVKPGAILPTTLDPKPGNT